MYRHEDITNIKVRVAENGGYVVNYTHHIPKMNHSESEWHDKEEIYQERDAALKRASELHAESVMYQEKYTNGEKSEEMAPVKPLQESSNPNPY